jgi:hypothetical protein
MNFYKRYNSTDPESMLVIGCGADMTPSQINRSVTWDNRDKDEMLAYLEERVEALKNEVRRLRGENAELMEQLVDARTITSTLENDRPNCRSAGVGASSLVAQKNRPS